MEQQKIHIDIKDALDEIANIARGIVTRELDKLFSQEIKLNIMGQSLQLDLNMTDFSDMNDLNQLMIPKKQIILISRGIDTGNLQGQLTITFSMNSALLISSLLENKKNYYDMLSEKDQIALKKIGRVLLDSYLSAFSTFLELPTTHAESNMFVLDSNKVVKFMQDSVEKSVKNTMIFQTKFSVPKTKLIGYFELMCTLKDIEPIIKRIKKKLGIGVDYDGIEQTSYLKLKNGNIVKNITDLINALTSMKDEEYSKYLSPSGNIFSDWLGKAYHDNEMLGRTSLRNTRQEMVTQLKKEKEKFNQKEKETEESQKIEDAISHLQKGYESMKIMVGELRKMGKDVSFPELELQRIPAKINLAKATQSLEDVQKIQNVMADIKKQLVAL